MNTSTPTPWIVPNTPDEIKHFICSSGRCKNYKKGDVLVEDDYLQKLFIVKSGMLKNSVTDFTLAKPFMSCGLRLPGHITGYTTYLLKEPAPLCVTAVEKSEICSVSFSQINNFLSSDNLLTEEFLRHCGRCLRADIDAMIVVTTMSAEERFWTLYASLFLSQNIDLSATWNALPFKIPRECLSDLIYSSTLTVDRLYSTLTKRGLIKKEHAKHYFKNTPVVNAIETIKRRFSGNS